MKLFSRVYNLFAAEHGETKQDWRAVGLVGMILPLLTVMVFSVSVESTPSVAMADDDQLAVHASATRTTGDLVVIRITGELAEAYARRTQPQERNKPVPSGLQIETSATIEQILDDGRYRIEHSQRINNDKNSPRLVTLTAIVDPKQLQTVIVPKDTPVSRSPADPKPELSKTDCKHKFLELSELKGIKLQTWELKEEIGQ